MRIAVLVVLVSMLWAGQGAQTVEPPCLKLVADFTSLLEAWERVGGGGRSGIEPDVRDAEVARAYIVGLAEGAMGTRCCIPTGIDTGDLMTLVARHWTAKLDKYDVLPSQRCARRFILEILEDRFPCPKKPAPPAPAK